MLNISDEHLVLRVREGYREAFTQLIQKYDRIIYALAFQRLKHQVDAEDITHETFLRAWGSLTGLRNPKLFKSWLLKIASNLCNEVLRKKEQEKRVSKEVSYAQLTGLTGNDCGANELSYTVLKIIDSLPEKYRLPLMLHLMEGMTVKEIAIRLGLAFETVRKQIYRGLQLLRQKLGPVL